MKFASLDEFIEDATERMEQGDETFRTLDITNPVAENHLEGEDSRFSDDIDESLENEMIIQLLNTARTSGHLINDLFLGFFQIDHEISLALVQLFQDENRSWKRLAIQRCPGRVLESCLSIVATRDHLESLCLYQNNLGYTGFSCLAMILASNSAKLVTLDLEDYISPNSADALAAGLKVNSTLRTLDLCYCRFDRDALEYITMGISQHSQLRTLLLTNCELTDMNAAFMINALVDHPSLRRIDLGLNYCCVKSMKALASAVRDDRMPKLESISLAHQCKRLDPRLAIPLPVGMVGGPLESNTVLKEISFSNNYLHPAELDFLMHGVKESRLEKLHLARCGISDKGLQSLLLKLPNTLRMLDLTENLFANEESNTALLAAVERHEDLENLKIDRDLDCWIQVCYQCRLNRGGRRIFTCQKTVPLSLWPRILERANLTDWSTYDPLDEGKGFPEDVIYHVLKGPAFCGRLS
jgi:hypothetical protein